MVNNFRKANNIEVTMGLNLTTQEMFKKLPEDLKIHVVRYALTELGLVGTNDAILSKLNSPTWKNTYIKFVTTPGNATLINFIKLLNEIVTSEYQFANTTNGPYQKERLLYQTFIDAIGMMNRKSPMNRKRQMNLEKQSLSVEPLEHSNPVSAVSLSRTLSEITSGGAGGRRRRGTKRARRGRRRSSRKN